MQISEFWETTKQELSKIDMDVAICENSDKSNREFTTFDIQMKSFGNDFISGWYSVPNHLWGKKAPAVLAVPGYGGIKEIPTVLPSLGFAVLTLFPRGQGESQKHWKLENSTKLIHNIHDKFKYYYRGAYMDCIRGIDFLNSMDEVDSNRIGMWSRSQGGGLTLATAALDSRVRCAVAEEPFLCNYPLAQKVNTSPYVELKTYLEQNPENRELALDTLQYFDNLNLAELITCPTLVSIGMKDETCPASTIKPVFERIKSVKSLITYPQLPHSPCYDFNNHAVNWLKTYLS